MIQQKQQSSSQPAQQTAANVTQNVPLTAQLFLFRQLIIDILNHCKKNIKSQPFEDMQVDKLVQTNLSRSIDIYQQYFLIGIGTAKTRELVCHRYERLVKQNLINKDNLPPQMITGIINARSHGPSGGGSTASSGSNSVVGSALNFNNDKPLEIGKLVSTIINLTIQPSAQITAGLGYLLEGTRNKNNGNLFVQIIQQVYSNLSKNRKKPIDRFLSNFIDCIVSEVEYHQVSYVQYQKKYFKQLQKNKIKADPSSYQTISKYNKMPLIMRQQPASDSQNIPTPPPLYNYIKQLSNPLSKQRMCIHPNQQDAKFGKCFMCPRGANNYDKNMFIPLCSMQCKNKLKRINQQCIINDHFNMLNWIIQVLSNANFMFGNGDQVMYSLLLRQLSQVDIISDKQIGSIMEIVINNFTMQAVGINNSSQNLQIIPNNIINKVIQNSALIVSCLIRKHPYSMFHFPKPQIYQQQQNKQIINKTLPNLHTTKILLTEMVTMLESLPISNNSLQLTLLKSFIQILSTKQINNTKQGLIVLKQLYLQCDCRILQTNLVERIFNIVSQYALYGTPNVKQNTNSSNANTQSLGTSTTITVQSMNAISSGAINNVNVNVSSGCNQIAISGLQEFLISIVKVMKYFDTIQDKQRNIADIIKQKKIKKHIQTKFVQDFNKKPIKAVDSLRKLFPKITARDIAVILKDNMDCQTKIKKSYEKINRQQVGTYFGTLKKDKNGIKDDYNQTVYWQFLKLLDHQYQGKQVDDCLRITFNAFKMPKEGQQVQVVLGPLSLALQPHLGMKHGNQATATYQLIMVALMVQTSNNPNVKQNQKLKYEGFKNFCSEIDKDLSQARMMQIYDRLKKRPLQIFIQYKGSKIFTKKYLKLQTLRTQFWRSLQNISLIQDKKQTERIQNNSTASVGKQAIKKLEEVSPKKSQTKKQESKQIKQQQKTIQKKQSKQQQSIDFSQQKKIQESRIQSKNSIQIVQQQKPAEHAKKSQNLLAFLFQNIWQYIYMTTVNRQNLKGLQQCCIVYGRSQLLTQFQAFFNHLYKIHQDLSQRSSNTLQSIANQAKLIILKLSIDYSNCVIGRQAWLIIIRIIYKLDIQEQDKNKNQSPKKGDNLYAGYEYEASDKLFTRTNTFKSQRLKEFLQAMCQFSSSEVKTDKKYTRQMYILHHIAEIIQYNLQRFERADQSQQQPSLWQVVWPTIRSYFRNICVHPRKQIAMSAIDSYKQLTMKMLKLPCYKQTQISHIQLMNLYLHVFQRSAAYIKDLIINILLNVVCKQMRAGWNQLYTILDLSDSDDKIVVMKVVARIIEDIGFQNAGNVLRLHQIVLKELRVANQDSYQLILKKLWQICQYFNRLDIWLETLSKIKDIYKSTINANILIFMYKICNHCISLIKNSKYKPQQDFPIKQYEQKSAEKIQNQLQQNYLSQANQQEISIYSEIKKISPEQAQRLIYFQVFSTQMYILQIKNVKLFCECVRIFKQLNLSLFFNNLGGDQERTGFLALWEMFLTSNYSVYFCYFLHDYLAIVFQQLANLTKFYTNQLSKQYIKQQLTISTQQKVNITKKQLLLWIIRQFGQTNKDEILQLCQQDSDLNKSFSQILTASSQQNLSTSKTQLIEFYLSSKEYQDKSIKHLVFLKIFKNYYESQESSNNNNRVQYVDQKVLQGVFESYQYSSQVNSKPLLRNFLWNNEFFKGHDYLPGLMKQELRSLQIIIKYFNVKEMKGKVYEIVYNFLKSFIQKALLFAKYSKHSSAQQSLANQPPKLSQPGKPQTLSSPLQPALQAMQRIIAALYQDLGLWITNSEQILTASLRKLTKQVKQIYNQQDRNKTKAHPFIDYRKLWILCVDLCKVSGSKNILKESSLLMEELMQKMY